jgi:CheY-like chemotaxis protein
MSNRNLILVADDDENDLKMTLAALTRVGTDPEVEVHTVHDGAEALDYLHGEGAFKDRPAGNPQVLLLDLNMPRIDGWEVLRQVKSEANLKTIPVVVFTSSSRDHDVEQCYGLGVNAYVVKPIDFQEFTEVVRDIEVFWTKRNHPPPAQPHAFEAAPGLAGVKAARPS